jgi:phenylacetate-CoA ligase
VLRIVLDRPGPLVTPPLKLRIEYGDENISADETQRLERDLMEHMRDRLRVNPQIELVSPQSLPREAGKTSLIEIREK